MRRDLNPRPLLGHYGHGAAASVAQPKVAGLPQALLVEPGVVLHFDYEHSALAEIVE